MTVFVIALLVVITVFGIGVIIVPFALKDSQNSHGTGMPCDGKLGNCLFSLSKFILYCLSSSYCCLRRSILFSKSVYSASFQLQVSRIASKFVTQKGVQSGRSHTVKDGACQNAFLKSLTAVFLFAGGAQSVFSHLSIIFRMFIKFLHLVLYLFKVLILRSIVFKLAGIHIFCISRISFNIL